MKSHEVNLNEKSLSLVGAVNKLEIMHKIARCFCQLLDVCASLQHQYSGSG